MKSCCYIRGYDRKAPKEVLKHKLPLLHHLERLKHFDPKALQVAAEMVAQPKCSEADKMRKQTNCYAR